MTKVKFDISQFYNIKTLKWSLSVLCVILGGIVYWITFDTDSFVDELTLVASLLFSVVVFYVISNLFEKPLAKFKSFFQKLVQGKYEEDISIDKGLNDIRELADLQKRFTSSLTGVKKAIFELENSNLDYEIENEENDVLKESLINLRNHLRKLEDEDNIRRWINEGLAKFADILRSDSDDLKVLASRIISNLVKYTKSNQAGLYILDDKKENLEQLAFYAYEREKFSKKVIPKGYGLLWQCAYEKKHIYITEVPGDYIQVKSGLGGASPTSVLLIPLKLEGEVYGIIEIASFDRYKDYEIEFLNKLAENIASTISVTKTNNTTRKLLEESEEKTKELQQQEQFMRQNMEEMQSTQEEMARIQEELLQKEYNINALLNSSDDTFFAIDREYKIIVVNKTLQDRYKEAGIDLKEGTNIFDCIPEDQHEVWRKRYDRSLSGESYIMDMERKMANGETKYLRGYYNCIKDKDGNVIGASVRSSDITEFNDLNIQIMDLQKELMELREEHEKLKDSKGTGTSSSKKSQGSSKEDSRLEKFRKLIQSLKNKK